MENNIKVENKNELLFKKENYLLMIVGILFIAVGFLLMMGNEANTTPSGAFDPNYWNQEIYSWRRIRLAPILIVMGFGIEIFSILYQPKNK